jgi:hypothetical protein
MVDIDIRIRRVNIRDDQNNALIDMGNADDIGNVTVLSLTTDLKKFGGTGTGVTNRNFDLVMPFEINASDFVKVRVHKVTTTPDIIDNPTSGPNFNLDPNDRFRFNLSAEPFTDKNGTILYHVFAPSKGTGSEVLSAFLTIQRVRIEQGQKDDGLTVKDSVNGIAQHTAAKVNVSGIGDTYDLFTLNR